MAFVIFYVPHLVVFAQPVYPVEHSKMELNEWYIEQYFKNAELSFIAPAGEIGAPDPYVLSSSLKTAFFILGTSKLPVAISLEPNVDIRVRRESSAGVRTPSFRLSGIIHARVGKSRTRYQYVEIGFTHHSNGQDGPAVDPDGSLNTTTGNFTTNFIVANYRMGQFIPSGFQAKGNYTQHSVGIQLHRLFKFEKAISSDYGFTRLLYQFSWRRYREQTIGQNRGERWRIEAGISYATNQISNYPFLAIRRRVNAESSFHLALPFMANTYVMSTIGYYGEDPYNIYYRNHYGFVRFGVSAVLGQWSRGH